MCVTANAWEQVRHSSLHLCHALQSVIYSCVLWHGHWRRSMGSCLMFALSVLAQPSTGTATHAPSLASTLLGRSGRMRAGHMHASVQHSGAAQSPCACMCVTHLCIANVPTHRCGGRKKGGPLLHAWCMHGASTALSTWPEATESWPLQQAGCLPALPPSRPQLRNIPSHPGLPCRAAASPPAQPPPPSCPLCAWLTGSVGSIGSVTGSTGSVQWVSH